MLPGVCAALALVAVAVTAAPPPGFVGGAACRECHSAEYERWAASHHALAMQVATPATVRGDFADQRLAYAGTETRFFRAGDRFLVRTDGPDGRPADFEVRYTFGVDPLQQYLVEFPGGRLQVLPFAWDTRPRAAGGQRWFHLYPNERLTAADQLHWTRPYQNWNMMCAECHSTGLEKRWDPEAAIYDTRWSEISVGCEACHGPGAAHVAWARAGGKAGGTAADMGLVQDLSSGGAAAWRFASPAARIAARATPANPAAVAVCAPCHARAAQMTEGADAHPGEPLTQHYRPALLEAPLFWPTGEQRDEVYVWNTFAASRMAQHGVVCADCHDAHAGGLRAPGNGVCLTCHQAAAYDVPAHHHHAAGGPGSACVDCHMPAATYMGNDERRDHSFQVPRPDLSPTTGSPNACGRCHAERGDAWSAAAMDRWYGSGWRQRPHWAGAFAAAERGSADAAPALVGLVDDAALPPIVRASALARLGALSPPLAVQSAVPLLAAEAPLLRATAVRQLEPLPAHERWRVAAPLLGDPDRWVRSETADLLAGTPAASLPAADRERLEGAVAEHARLVRQQSDFPSNATALGGFAARRGDTVEAERWLRRALRGDPQFVGAWVNLADLRRTQGRDVEGAAVLAEGLRQAPDAADLHHALGLTRVRLRDVTAAMPSLRRATELAPDDLRYAYVYAVALHDTGQRAAAIAELQRIRQRHPHNGDLAALLDAWQHE